jgi:hypothetical protein
MDLWPASFPGSTGAAIFSESEGNKVQLIFTNAGYWPAIYFLYDWQRRAAFFLCRAELATWLHTAKEHTQ